MDDLDQHLEKAKRHLQLLELKDCLEQIESILALNVTQEDPYCIGIRAAQLGDDPNKLLDLIERGSHSIQGDRINFLETSYAACKKINMLKQCAKLADELTSIGNTNKRVDLLLYKADYLIANNEEALADQLLYNLVEQFPKNLNCRIKAIDCKRVRQDWTGAIQMAKKTVELFPDSWLSYDNLAEEYLRAGKAEEAKALYNINIQEKQISGDNIEQRSMPLAVLQYYSPNDQQNHDKARQAKIALVNQKISLQWRASIGKDGDYRLVDLNQAMAMIDQTLGQKKVDLFRKCALPAMQADVARVVHLATNDHALYIDWPHRPFQRSNLLSQKLFHSKKSLLAGKRKRQDWELWNGFAYSNPKHSLKNFFSEILEEIFYNIKHEICNNVAVVTGPGVWRSVFKRDHIYSQGETLQQIRFPSDIKQVFLPALDKRPSMVGHWSVVQKKQSIFNKLARES